MIVTILVGFVFVLLYIFVFAVVAQYLVEEFTVSRGWGGIVFLFLPIALIVFLVLFVYRFGCWFGDYLWNRF